MFKSIPAQLTKNASRFQTRTIVGYGMNNSSEATLIKEMEDSMTVNISHHANDPNVGLALHADYDRYKMYLAIPAFSSRLLFGITPPRRM